MLRRLLQLAALRHLGASDAAVCALGERPDLVLRDVAGDHDDGVVRSVPVAVEVEGVARRERPDLGFPTDHRPPVGMIEVAHRLRFLVQQGP